ncbi:unnamed protein product [Parnassius apollo]|uniref:(apollo) hypothetical protein n=1 Tax=Parnassius apollo TaxID=110799 RepID=A0A8S3YFA8_PARAO|nr:unnamed protein product [Parnassius apollo]
MSKRQHDDAIAGPSREMPEGRLWPCYPRVVTPEATVRTQGDPVVYQATSSGRIRPWIPASTPTMASPSSLVPEAAGVKKRCRRALNLKEIAAILQDSGSDGENDDDEEDSEGDNDIPDFVRLRQAARNLRNVHVRDQRNMFEDDDDEDLVMCDEIDKSAVKCENDENEEDNEWHVNVQESARENENEETLMEDERIKNERIENANGWSERGGMTGSSGAAAPIDTTFFWSEDFTSFTAQKETYLRVPGPTFSSQDPTAIFCKIWDREFMDTIVRETNEYACEIISQLSDPDIGGRIPNYLDSWTDTTVEELYRYFAVLIYLSFCHRSKIHEYWDTGILEMPSFRRIMSRTRFLLLTKFFHFVSNKNLVNRGYERKVEKIAPVVDHCNRKFAEMYTPSQYLSLDESLLLWKGRLSWRQCIRTKAARFGIKSFELCEAETGYLLQYRLYTGKNTAMYPGPSHGFNDKTAKVVLQLMEGYLDAGHVLVMDNWYNQLPLTRYLKSRCTDVLGTINRRQKWIPQAIKELNPKQLERGVSVGRHCGDIALVAWKDVKLVTLLSTYHQHEMVPGRRARQSVLKPTVVQEYNRYMGGVDLKDQKLSKFLLERKRNRKWYMKVFKRLLNTSLLNAFIIYLRNPMYHMYSHRQFRLKVAEGLLSRYPCVSSVPPRVPNQLQRLALRLELGNHFPIYTEAASRPGKQKRKQLRCVRCAVLKKRVVVTIMCKLCQVPLCLGKCWEDYHTVKNL